MNSLPTLASISTLSKSVKRILGCNPSKMTLQGTNCYLVGHQSSLILIDTAQGLPEFIPLLKQALESYEPCGVISNIVLTHYHGDHVNGLTSVLSLMKDMKMPAVAVWKFKCEEKDEGIQATLGESKGLFVPFSNDSNLHFLNDQQSIPLSSNSTSSPTLTNSIQIIHTPGHTSDSISLYLASERVLFSADTVLGHGTAVFENLGWYISSLEKCISILEKEDGDITIYPGHGEVVQGGVAKLKEYVKHRMEREAQVVESLSKNASSEGVLAESLTEDIYKDTIPKELIPLATRGLLLHLEKLLSESKVERIQKNGDTTADLMPGWSDKWKLIDSGQSKM